MTKVKSNDLKRLIAQYYCNFIENVSVYDVINGRTDINIEMNSIYIKVSSHNRFSDVKARKKKMEKFAKHIEAVTFGNLKVAYMICKIDGPFYVTHMDIANSYEVIE